MARAGNKLASSTICPRINWWRPSQPIDIFKKNKRKRNCSKRNQKEKETTMNDTDKQQKKIKWSFSLSRISAYARCSYVQLKITRNKKKRRRKIVPRSALFSYFCWRTRDHCCRYLFMSRLVCRSDKIAFTRQQCRFRRNQDQLRTHTFQCLQQTRLFIQGNTTARNLI